MTGPPTEGISGLPLPDGVPLTVIGPVPAARVAQARERRAREASDGELLRRVRDLTRAELPEGVLDRARAAVREAT